MLLQFPDSPVKVDGNPILEDLEIYIAPDKRIRIRMKYFRGDGSKAPADVIIQKYEAPKLNKLSLMLPISGFENHTKKTFSIKLGYDFFSKNWKVSGNVDSQVIDRQMSTIMELLVVGKEMFVGA